MISAIISCHLNHFGLKPADQFTANNAISLHVPVGNLLKKSVTSPAGISEVHVGLVTVNLNSGEIMYERETSAPAEADRMAVACRQLLYPKQ